MPEYTPEQFDPAKALDNCFYFCDRLFTYHGVKIYPFGEVHKEILNRIISNRWSLTVIPVSHLKTTLVSMGYNLWRFWRESNYWVAMVGNSQDRTKDVLEQITYYIENTPWLKHLIPEKNDSTWNKKTIISTTRNKITVEPFNSSARGIQPNEIIYDDLLRDEEGVTDMPMSTIIDTFFGVFLMRGNTKFCRHHLVGTPQSDADLYVEIESRIKSLKEKYGVTWSIVRYSGIILDDEGNDKDVLWPERYTLKELQMMRDLIGQYRFNREIMCNPTKSGSSFYPNIGMTTDDQLTFSYTTKGNVYVGFDFATSTSATADWNVAIVVDEVDGYYKKKLEVDGVLQEFTVKNPVIIKNIYRFKGDEMQMQVAREIWKTYKPLKYICDKSNIGQKYVKQFLAEGLPVEGFDFQKDRRRSLLINMRMLFETDKTEPLLAPRLVIPTSDSDETFSKTKILISEVSKMQEGKTRTGQDTFVSMGKHDDACVSLAMAVKDVQYRNYSDVPVILTANKMNTANYSRSKPVYDKEHKSIVVEPGKAPTADKFKIKLWS